MAIADLTDWIDEYSRPDTVWCAKRLSANDTLASGGHQAGPYIPKELIFELFPSINRREVLNPDIHFDLFVDSHPDACRARAVWYNNKFHSNGDLKKRRNEARLTNFGGQKSALLNPDSTGALTVFAFRGENAGKRDKEQCHVWVCSNPIEEDLVEAVLGPVEPKMTVVWRPGSASPETGLFGVSKPPMSHASCWLDETEIPELWKVQFPTGLQIIDKTIEMRPLDGCDVDVRLIRRRKCEFEIFRSVEQSAWLPKIKNGFEDIDSFLKMANTILQSRKSRSGKSLEYHTKSIFEEEGFVRGRHYEHNPVVEGGKRPDFLFPTVNAYENKSFPEDNLRILAVKTTCKDRWRQILNEADRVSTKHLLTLQEGVSEGQYREMAEAGVCLVVPASLQNSYPKSVKPHLVTLESFIGDLRILLAKAGLSP